MTVKNQIAQINMILDHAEMDFVGYEFEATEDIFIEEIGDTQSLFRLNVCKETGKKEVYCAYSEDFDIMEEATEYFDVEKLLVEAEKYIADRKDNDSEKIENYGDVYVHYCKLCDDGWECDEAMTQAWLIAEGHVEASI